MPVKDIKFCTEKRLDVENMSRQQLIDSYFDCIALIDEFSGVSLKEPLINFLINRFGKEKSNQGRLSYTPRTVSILLALSRGGLKTYNYLSTCISQNYEEGDGNQYLVSGIADCRYFLSQLGVDITNVFGYGYYIDNESLIKFRNLIRKG